MLTLAFNVPTSGTWAMDVFLMLAMFFSGSYLAFKGGNKWGVAVMGLAGYWAYLVFVPMLN